MLEKVIQTRIPTANIEGVKYFGTNVVRHQKEGIRTNHLTFSIEQLLKVSKDGRTMEQNALPNGLIRNHSAVYGGSLTFSEQGIGCFDYGKAILD